MYYILYFSILEKFAVDTLCIFVPFCASGRARRQAKIQRWGSKRCCSVLPEFNRTTYSPKKEVSSTILVSKCFWKCTASATPFDVSTTGRRSTYSRLSSSKWCASEGEGRATSNSSSSRWCASEGEGRATSNSSEIEEANVSTCWRRTKTCSSC